MSELNIRSDSVDVEEIMRRYHGKIEFWEVVNDPSHLPSLKIDQGSFIPGGGMLREDLSPKLVYEQLKRLIHDEWNTRALGTTDGEGRFGFRGVPGDLQGHHRHSRQDN